MGKLIGINHQSKDETQDKQPGGCMWGLVHVLGYNNRHSNVRKMIHGRPTHHSDWTPEANIYENDGYEAQTAKRSRATKKRSLRARVKALLAHEISKDKTKPKLQRTYSIHHLESVDDDGSGKLSTNWKQQIIFLPKDAGNSSSQSAQTKASSDEPDLFEILKVDKELLLKHLQESDKGIASFSKGAFSKSRSFPVADLARGRKLKPVKLESKQKEVWSLPRENKLTKKEVSNAAGGEDDARKRRHLRSASLNESLDKYARLFENRSGKYTALNSSRSLKLTNEYGIAPLYSTRMHSLSYVDSYYSDLDLERLVDIPLGIDSGVIRKNTSSGLQEEENASADVKMQIDGECESLRSCTRGLDNEQSSVLDECRVVEPQIYEGVDHGCGVHELSASIATLDLENDESSIKIANSEHDGYPKKKSDLDYVRNLLEQSGISVDASEMAWHSSNELFSPQLFEEVEARWPHARGELTGRPDFYGCWHHRMLFDLVNEVLLEVYDISLPYYPEPLSSSCLVRPFPIGDHITEEVCRSIGRLVDMKGEENESLDGIVARDLDHDRRWMNLQTESEFVGFDIEDMIFDELVQEVVLS